MTSYAVDIALRVLMVEQGLLHIQKHLNRRLRKISEEHLGHHVFELNNSLRFLVGCRLPPDQFLLLGRQVTRPRFFPLLGSLLHLVVKHLYVVVHRNELFPQLNLGLRIVHLKYVPE